MIPDEQFYLQAEREFESGGLDDALAAKARALSEGEEGFRKQYIALRVTQLKQAAIAQYTSTTVNKFFLISLLLVGIVGAAAAILGLVASAILAIDYYGAHEMFRDAMSIYGVATWIWVAGTSILGLPIGYGMARWADYELRK